MPASADEENRLDAARLPPLPSLDTTADLGKYTGARVLQSAAGSSTGMGRNSKARGGRGELFSWRRGRSKQTNSPVMMAVKVESTRGLLFGEAVEHTYVELVYVGESKMVCDVDDIRRPPLWCPDEIDASFGEEVSLCALAMMSCSFDMPLCCLLQPPAGPILGAHYWPATRDSIHGREACVAVTGTSRKPQVPRSPLAQQAVQGAC